MSITPQPGERWYYQTHLFGTKVCRIIGVNGGRYFISDHFYSKRFANSHELLCKWEPNWFQRLLGYK